METNKEKKYSLIQRRRYVGGEIILARGTYDDCYYRIVEMENLVVYNRKSNGKFCRPYANPATYLGLCKRSFIKGEFFYDTDLGLTYEIEEE